MLTIPSQTEAFRSSKDDEMSDYHHEDDKGKQSCACLADYVRCINNEKANIRSNFSYTMVP